MLCAIADNATDDALDQEAQRSAELGDGRIVSDEASLPGREWFRALAESSRDIVFVRGVDGMLAYCSPAVWGSLGYRPEDLEGTNERRLIHPVDLGKRDRLIAALLETALRSCGECRQGLAGWPSSHSAIEP